MNNEFRNWKRLNSSGSRSSPSYRACRLAAWCASARPRPKNGMAGPIAQHGEGAVTTHGAGAAPRLPPHSRTMRCRSSSGWSTSGPQGICRARRRGQRLTVAAGCQQDSGNGSARQCSSMVRSVQRLVTSRHSSYSTGRWGRVWAAEESKHGRPGTELTEGGERWGRLRIWRRERRASAVRCTNGNAEWRGRQRCAPLGEKLMDGRERERRGVQCDIFGPGRAHVDKTKGSSGWARE
jgi:hypothetical protein